jgi:anti-sigma factor RsiW
MSEPERGLEAAERELDRALSLLEKRKAPDRLKARLGAVIEAAPAAGPVAAPLPRVSSRRTAILSLSLAATVVLAGGLGFGWFRSAHDADLLVTEAVNDHLRVLYAERPLEVESSDRHQVKPWFEGKLDFAPVLAFAGDDEFTLAGGAVAYFMDRKAAAFVFKRRLHVMTLFVFRAEGLPWPRTSNQVLGKKSASYASSRGFGTLLYREGDLGYALVSDADTATLLRLGTKLVEAH